MVSGWSPDRLHGGRDRPGRNFCGYWPSVSKMAHRADRLATWSFIGQVAWLGDGSGLVFNAWQQRWGVYGDQIWLLTFPKGEARPVTKDMNNYEGVSVSANLAAPGAMVTQRTDRVSRISIVSKGAGGFDAERAAQIQSSFSGSFSEVLAWIGRPTNWYMARKPAATWTFGSQPPTASARNN